MAIKKKGKIKKKQTLDVVSAPMRETPEEVLSWGVSPTGMLSFIECRLKRKLRLDGWKSRRFANAASFGSFGHLVFEKAYQRLMDCKSTKVKLNFIKNNSSGLQKLVEDTFEEFAKTESFTLADERNRAEYELWIAQLQVLLPEYFAYYGREELGWNWISTEYKIENLKYRGTKLNGYLDYLHRKGDTIVIMDNKFKGRISEENLLKVLDHDFQMYFYAYCIWKLFGIVPKYALYNVIRRPSIKLNVKETIPQHKARLREMICKDPDHFFKRYEIPFDIEGIVRFEKDLAVLVDEYTQWLEAGSPCVVFGNPCENKFGVCEYYDLCHYNQSVGFLQEPREKKGK